MKAFLEDEQATVNYGKKLAEWIPQKGVIFLHGSLGAGKTTLVRGLLQAKGHQGNTKSPTFTLVEPYQINGNKFYHFDLYRLTDPEELEYMGFRDYLGENSLSLIEWPEKGEGFLPKPDLELTLNYQGEQRNIEINIINPEWKELVTP